MPARLRRTSAATLGTVLGLSLTLLAPTAGPAAAAPPASPPASSGSERPTLDRGELRTALRAIVRRGAVGVSAEVVRGDQVWRGAVGEARLAPDRAARPDAHVRVASVTKQIVSVLALQLVERGRWTLDTTIADVLPGLWPARGDVTLRQLLSHTSGMPDMLVPLLAEAPGDTNADFVRVVSQRRTDRELVAAARSQPWLFEPGTDFGYSNTNYVVVGMMLRRATGRGLPALVRERVLRPAGMRDSHLATRPGLSAPALHEYAVIGAKPVDLGRFDPSMFSAAGALVATMGDLDRFQLALSTGRLIPRSLVREMRGVEVVDDETGLRYGLGSYRIADPCRPGKWLFGHDGGSWGTFTMTFSSPGGARRLSVAMTGRDYDGELGSVKALSAFVDVAAAQGCASPSRASADRPLVGAVG